MKLGDIGSTALREKKSSIYFMKRQLETGKSDVVGVSRYASLAANGSDHLSVMKKIKPDVPRSSGLVSTSTTSKAV
ncbi:unnamed protein product [Fusarium graminearum]|uniref:Uncharacterized protein n=1 Tax=Gibberella zeae TaxID=5518 RepID=A0A4E9DZG4_GIBZA|nr:unnamed protein product [Fusarium graminearum]CAG1971476.1 unnamed protein product [Fusarium graminearum]CAG2007966.1 unnamed protein product [Fusarium graminearum]